MSAETTWLLRCANEGCVTELETLPGPTPVGWTRVGARFYCGGCAP